MLSLLRAGDSGCTHIIHTYVYARSLNTVAVEKKKKIILIVAKSSSFFYVTAVGCLQYTDRDCFWF